MAARLPISISKWVCDCSARLGKRFEVPQLDELVDSGHRSAGIVHDMADSSQADESGATGYKDFHGAVPGRAPELHIHFIRVDLTGDRATSAKFWATRPPMKLGGCIQTLDAPSRHRNRS